MGFHRPFADRFAVTPSHPATWSGSVRAAAVSAILALVLVVAGCGTPTIPQTNPTAPHETNPANGGTTSGPSFTPTPAEAPVTLTANIGNGAQDVTVDTLVQFEASSGTLTDVKVTAPITDKNGKTSTATVPGELTKDHKTWIATEGLEPGATYTVAAKTTTAGGLPGTASWKFTTQKLTLDQQTFPSIAPLGGTVGVGMPAIITFDIPVKDRAAIEKNLHISMTPVQEGSWYWVSDSEVHWRPRNYWIPGTKVTVDARLNGVKAGPNLWGQSSRTWSFQIGRKVVAKTDLAAHTTKVYINDQLARTIKISAGKAGFITRSGIKVISEKYRSTPMASETQDITDPDYYNLANVEYAMRLTNSGEFFHAAPWNAARFGNTNSSHGCTGMSLSDAAWLFNTMNVGDPAEFTGSDRGMEPGNGYTDWNLTWSQVQARSAL